LLTEGIQAFFSYRIWRVSSKLWLAIPPWFITFARVAVTMSAVAILSEGEKGYKQFTEKDTFLVDLALGLGMAVDVWNTVALSYYLWTVKSTVFKRCISFLFSRPMTYRIIGPRT
jgi:hypothetical protein